MHYESWCSLTDDELRARDLGEINLAAAYGLPCAGKLDIQGLCGQLDQWADLVGSATQRLARRFQANPSAYGETRAHFCMLVLVTVLQRDLDVRYDVRFSEGPYDGSDSRNLFIHGLLSGHGGTCATMPVLYAAIGRRLGYPIRLAQAMEHLYCRWEDPNGEEFDIEATTLGYSPRPPGWFKTFPKPVPENEIEPRQLYRSMTPREELAFFLDQRGICWRENLEMRRSMEAACWASRLAPKNRVYLDHWALSDILDRAVGELRRQSDENPYLVTFRMPPPQARWEREVYPVAQRELSRILDNRFRRLQEHGAASATAAVESDLAALSSAS